MNGSNRGRLLAPDLDDRTWQDLVDQARDLIPVYAPDYTDHNPSDPLITLVELFAWMVEGMTYRLNQVPEKHYIEFLNLLGITRDPPTPAQAFLTFTATPTSPAAGVLVPRRSRAQTRATETEPPVVFETDEDVTVLPVNLGVALLIGKAILTKYSNVSRSFTVPPAQGDLITVAQNQSAQLCLGFDAATTQQIELDVRLFRPVIPDPVTGTTPADVDWLYSTGTTEPTSWTPIPTVLDETNGLQRNGKVRLTLPSTWASQVPGSWTSVAPTSAGDVVSDPYFWIGLRIGNLGAAPLTVGINWVLFNAVSSHNALTVTNERLGESDGTPFQVLELRNRPLYRKLDTETPYEDLQVQVAGQAWTLAEDLPEGPGQVYTIDPVAGEIRFGNHDQATQPTGHGSIPPKRPPSPPPGSVWDIVAQRYRYVAGGANGNVAGGTLTELATPVTGIIAVTNVVAAFGGSDEEPIEETKRRAPELLRNRYRAVTIEDYAYLAREVTTDVAKVQALAPRSGSTGAPWTFGGIDRSPGNVTLIVVPYPRPNEARPEPTPKLVREVQADLDRRRDLTARLRVTGPRYLPVRVTADMYVWQSAIAGGLLDPTLNGADAYAALVQRIQRFLHPVTGGADGTGFEVGQSLFIAELFNAIKPDGDIGYLALIAVEAQTPAYSPTARPFPLSPLGAWVRAADYELICYGSHNVPTHPPQS